MSIAEKLKIEGRREGCQEGSLLGKTETLQDFPGLRPIPTSELAARPPNESEAPHRSLLETARQRFKN